MACAMPRRLRGVKQLSEPQQGTAINNWSFQSLERRRRWPGQTSTQVRHVSYCLEAGRTPSPVRPRRRRTLQAVFRTADGMDTGVLISQSEQCGACLLVSTHKPVPSQQRILSRVCWRLLNTNNVPRHRGSSPSRSVTSAYKPLNPLRRSPWLHRHQYLQAA